MRARRRRQRRDATAAGAASTAQGSRLHQTGQRRKHAGPHEHLTAGSIHRIILARATRPPARQVTEPGRGGGLEVVGAKLGHVEEVFEARGALEVGLPVQVCRAERVWGACDRAQKGPTNE